MKKLEYIFGSIAILAVASGYFLFKNKVFEKETPAIRVEAQAAPITPDLVSKQDLKMPAGIIVELIKSKNWIGLSEEFAKEKQKPEEIEGKLSQIMYSLDSKLVEDSENENIASALLLVIDSPDELQPRGRILVSKAIGKLKLSDSLKNSITKKYTRNKWTEMHHWLDASVGWNPLPGSTVKVLNTLLVKNRSDLMSDYFYYLNKIENKKELKKQIKSTKNKMAEFPTQQKNYIQAQLDQIERKL